MCFNNAKWKRIGLKTVDKTNDNWQKCYKLLRKLIEIPKLRQLPKLNCLEYIYLH